MDCRGQLPDTVSSGELSPIPPLVPSPSRLIQSNMNSWLEAGIDPIIYAQRLSLPRELL